MGRIGTVAIAAMAMVWAAGMTARAEGPSTAPATAPAATVANPQYDLWCKYKPGSTVTLAGDMEAGPMGKVHLAVTQTLASVTADAVTVSQTTQMSVMGHDRPAGPPGAQVIPARQAKAQMTATGAADVQAMGKTFPCTVYDMAKPAGGGPASGTAYVNPDVPGGVVKLTLTGANGKALTFVLTAADAK